MGQGNALTVVKSEPIPALTVVQSQPATPSQSVDAHGQPPPRGDRAASAIADLHARTENARNLFDSWVKEGPHRVVQGIHDLLEGNYAKGAHDVVAGGTMTALPMVAPRVGPAIVASPLKSALIAAPSIVAQQAAQPIAEAVGATPDQAALVGDVASIGAGAGMAKLAVPALARWSVNNKGIRVSRDYMQSTRDIQAALGVNAEDVHRARPFLEAVHQHSVPIVGKEANGGASEQLVKAANIAIDEIEQHVASLVQQFPGATTPPQATAIMQRIAKMPGASPADREAALKVIREYGLDRPRSLAEAESLRVRLNAENRSTLEGSGIRQRTATMTNAAYVARQEAANQLREGIYGTLEQRGVEGIRDLRLSEGSIIKLRNAADPLTRGLRSESTVARTGETSLLRRTAQHVLRGGGAAVGAQIGGMPGAAIGAELGQEIGAGLTSKNMSRNALLERAFQQQFTSRPVMSVQGIRAPRTAPPAPRALPPAALPPGSTNLPTGYR